MRRKICPSPVGMWMPSSRRAASVNSRSPQALSIGGSAPSATVTEKPFFRAAIRQPRRTASYDQEELIRLSGPGGRRRPQDAVCAEAALSRDAFA